MAKIASFKLKSRDNLTTFLKKFTPIDKFILVELTKASLICKTSTPDRSTLKYSKMAVANVLEGDVPGDMRMPVADASKVANILKKFQPEDEVFLDLQYEEAAEGYLVVTQVTFRAEKLKIKMTCGDALLAKFISPDVLKKVIRSASDSKLVDIPLKVEYFDEITSLRDIDVEKDKLRLHVAKDGKFTVSGSNFDCELDTVPAVASEVDFKMKSSMFSYIDSELSTLEIGASTMVVRSQETDTITVMSNIEE